ncbi:hypothetical protein ALI22I_45850 [Saccharothrix sp. ALI-22-I]|uniref:hypothetical protein n=1 Tax=Saccharothrix sp. ALI-22-I TaxID=1933778 RepID=UPI00097BC67B|nr:hypothetical protein [Saccharothrix sp. ALI-22-I]ONI80595.1 hypothetical protein ALI22I_45850 [Saccharothrix sp. ALI-22-I]
MVVVLVIGGLLGAFHGVWAWRTRLYPRGRRGWVLGVVDATWSLPNTVAGAVFLAYALARGNRVDPAFSRHRGTLGLRDGVIKGFATTIGPVQAGIAMGVDDHEAVHVFQARLFGPLYLPLVAANWVVATVLPYWLLYHDRAAAPIDGVPAYFRRGVYPHCWHEEWAYRRQGAPPS